MYRKAWEKDSRFKAWLCAIKGQPHEALCRVCKKEMTAVVTTLQKHASTAYHKEQINRLQIPSSSRIDCLFRAQQESSDPVKEAELKLASFIAEHNLSFNLMDHLSDLLPRLFPDSKIAADVRCKRTKTKCIVKNALSPFFHGKLVDKLKSHPFSLIIDETTDVSTQKELALVTRQYDKETKKVTCALYELVELSLGNAEAIFKAICGLLEKDGIPINKIVGFAADTTNVMFGQHNSVVSRFKDKIPNLFVFRCICHSAHLCASHACEKLPRTAEDLIHDVYNYFAHSAKRQSDFKKFQFFAEVEPHRILKRSQTRWLSLHSCVQQLLEQWDALLIYFQSVAANDNLLASQKILSVTKSNMETVLTFS
jgi:hypothetical protein